MAIQYKIYSAQVTKDGSGALMLDVEALDNTGVAIPGKHQTIAIPASAVAGCATLAQCAAAIKAVIAATPGWSLAELTTRDTSNKNEESALTGLLTKVTFPVTVNAV